MSGTGALRIYRREWLLPDLAGGLTVGAMLVPQSMAYAELAGVPASTGLYAALVAPVAYAFVGTSRHLGTGPEPGTAILAAAGVAAMVGPGATSARYLTLMGALAMVVGVIALLAYLLRLGFVANVLSRPVLSGYITGVALVLVGSQLQSFTGVPIEADGLVSRLVQLVSRLSRVDGPTFVAGSACLAIMLVLRRHAPRIPGALAGVGIVTLASWAMDLPARGVATIGSIPSGLPEVGVPVVSLHDLRALVPVALGIALVGYSDNVLTARAIAGKMGYRIDPAREWAGLAVANLSASVVQGMPVSSSASRSAVPASLGSITSLVSLVGSGFVAVVLLVASSLLGHVPRAALAAVILLAAFSIIDVAGFVELWHLSRAEFALAAVTTLGVVVFDVLVGVLAAVVMSMVIALGRMARPHDAILGNDDALDGWVAVDEYPDARPLPGLLVYRFDAPLFFANAERFRSRLLRLLETNPGPEHWVILDLEGVGTVDTTAIDMLEGLLSDLAVADVDVVAVARPNVNVRDRLTRGGLLRPHGRLHCFPTIAAAVRQFEATRDTRPSR